MEILGIFVGIVLGLFGSIFSVWQFFYLRKHDKYNRKRDAEIDHKDRMMFLAQLIMDKDIKKESRQPFYDEYISKGGNESFVIGFLSDENLHQARRTPNWRQLRCNSLAYRYMI